MKEKGILISKLSLGITLLLILLSITSCLLTKNKKEDTLKEALNGRFYIGVALNAQQIKGVDTAAVYITQKHFNSIVAENCMKMENLQPVKDSFNFSLSDAFVEFGEKNKMKIIGHCLVWHSQAPKWLFVDDKGNDVSRDELIARMKNHIHTVVTRYKGRVHGWDVVNEAISDDGEYRKSKWYTIIGPEYIELAFKFAHEADPDAELYYNDYNEWNVKKRDAIYNLVKSLKEKGIKVDGIGMQGHIGINDPSIEEYEQAILKYAELGKVMITELDISVLPWPFEYFTADVNLNVDMQEKYNPYRNGLPDSVQQAFTARVLSLFELFLKHSDKIDRITFWGVHDAQSWKNYWPMPGRTDYPLLFDRNYAAKPVVQEIINLTKNTK